MLNDNVSVFDELQDRNQRSTSEAI